MKNRKVSLLVIAVCLLFVTISPAMAAYDYSASLNAGQTLYVSFLVPGGTSEFNGMSLYWDWDENSGEDLDWKIYTTAADDGSVYHMADSPFIEPEDFDPLQAGNWITYSFHSSSGTTFSIDRLEMFHLDPPYGTENGFESWVNRTLVGTYTFDGTETDAGNRADLFYEADVPFGGEIRSDLWRNSEVPIPSAIFLLGGGLIGLAGLRRKKAC